MPKADTTNTTTTPAPDLARTTPGRRGLLGGAAALLAGAAAVTLPRPVRAAGTDRDAGLLGPGADPVLALWRHYNDLLRQQDPISDSADALRAALTARWGEAGMATLSDDCGATRPWRSLSRSWPATYPADPLYRPARMGSGVMPSMPKACQRSSKMLPAQQLMELVRPLIVQEFTHVRARCSPSAGLSDRWSVEKYQTPVLAVMGLPERPGL